MFDGQIYLEKALEHAKPIYEMLTSGQHISNRYLEDAPQYYPTLQEYFNEYQFLFNTIGFELVHHPAQFFYLTSESAKTDEPGEKIRRSSVVTFCLIDFFGNKGQDLSHMIDQDIRVTKTQLEEFFNAYSDKLALVNIKDFDSLLSFFTRSFAPSGFVSAYLAEGTDREGFSLYPPLHRFIDICNQLNNEHAQSSEGASHE